MQIKLLDRYIFSQILKATIFSIFLVIVIWISPEILFKIIRKFIHGEIPLEIAVKLFFLEIPEILTKAIPVGLMIASLAVFDTLSKNSELTIMRMSGVSMTRLIMPVLLLGIIGCWLCFLVHKNWIPYSTSAIKQLKNDVFQSHFVYIDKNEFNKPEQILIVGGYTGEILYNIKLLKFSDKVQSDTPLMDSIVTADFAEIHEDNWTLVKGIEYKIAPNGVYKEMKPFDNMEIFDRKTSEIAERLLIYSTKRPREMTNEQLQEYMSLLKSLEMMDEYRFTLSKYYQRFAQAFGCILLAICGVLLGTSRPREKRFIGFTAGAILIFGYYIFIPFLDMLAQLGTLTPALAAWFPNIAVLTAIPLIIKYKNI